MNSSCELNLSKPCHATKKTLEPHFWLVCSNKNLRREKGSDLKQNCSEGPLHSRMPARHKGQWISPRRRPTAHSPYFWKDIGAENLADTISDYVKIGISVWVLSFLPWHTKNMFMSMTFLSEKQRLTPKWRRQQAMLRQKTLYKRTGLDCVETSQIPRNHLRSGEQRQDDSGPRQTDRHAMSS